MLVSDLACREMDDRSRSLFAWCALLFRRLRSRSPQISPEPLPAPNVSEFPSPAPPAEPAVVTADTRFRWRRHPLLLNAARTDDGLEDLDRSARAAAIRGMFLARGNRFDEAREAFLEAVREPGTDLAAIPGFWDLSRGGMQAAVDAYEQAGRLRDSASLAARIRRRHRPRALSSLPVAQRSQAQ